MRAEHSTSEGRSPELMQELLDFRRKMKRSRYTEPQIQEILGEFKSGFTITEICAKHGISASTFYAWKARFNSLNSVELNLLQRLQKENRRLRQQILAFIDESDKLKGLIRAYKTQGGDAVASGLSDGMQDPDEHF